MGVYSAGEWGSKGPYPGQCGRAVVILGDANSAGYLSDDNGERAFVDAAARGVGMSVVTGELGCSEYWRQSEGVYSPSLLDQAVATEGVVQRGSARVHGYCEALGCKAYRGKGRRRGGRGCRIIVR